MMKTYKYKIAHFTPDRLLIWSKEHTIEAEDLADAHFKLAILMRDKGYLMNIDFEIVYLEEVK